MAESTMHGPLKCHICTKSFSCDVFQPRMLTCGHTICTSCLDAILSTSKECPHCRQPVAGNSASAFPINFYVMEIIESHTHKGFKADYLKTEISSLKDRFSKLEKQLNSLQMSKDSNLELVLTNIVILNDLISKWDSLREDEVFAVINMVRKQFNTICLSVTEAMSMELLIFSPDSSISFKSSDFENRDTFLEMIYKRISKGEHIVAQLKIADKVKWANLSIWKNKLKVHSFGLQEIKSTATESQKIKTVCFEDLKKCLEESGKLAVFLTMRLFGDNYPFHLFLDLCESPIKKYFVHRCSGELGNSLKGTEVSKSTFNSISMGYNNLIPQFQFMCNEELQSLFTFTEKPGQRFDLKESQRGNKRLVIGVDVNRPQLHNFYYGKVDKISPYALFSSVIGICVLEEFESCSTAKYLDEGTSYEGKMAIIDCGLSIEF